MKSLSFDLHQMKSETQQRLYYVTYIVFGIDNWYEMYCFDVCPHDILFLFLFIYFSTNIHRVKFDLPKSHASPYINILSVNWVIGVLREELLYVQYTCGSNACF